MSRRTGCSIRSGRAFRAVEARNAEDRRSMKASLITVRACITRLRNGGAYRAVEPCREVNVNSTDVYHAV